MNIDEKQNATLNDKMHAVCMVEGNSNFESYPPELTSKLENIKKTVSKKGKIVCSKFLKNWYELASQTKNVVITRSLGDKTHYFT